MKAMIEPDSCLGCGMCAELCPEVFRLADDNLATVYAAVSDPLLLSAREAEQACPMAIIHITN